MDTPESIPNPPPVPRAELKTDRLVLRPWREEDISAIHEICQDPEIARWTTIPQPYRVADAEMFVREITANGYARGTDAVFGIFVRETGQIAGAIGLHDIRGGSLPGPSQTRRAELGYWANAATRGRGYMTEAVREVVRWGFDELKLQRVLWQAYDGNIGSRRVAEKAGFTMVGLQRGSHLVRGRVVDMWLADLLATDPRP